MPRIINLSDFAILEGKLYGKNQVEQINNKIGGDSDTINKLQIFGLFREQRPFSSIGDISKLQSKEQLNQIYQQWYDFVIDKLVHTTEFIENTGKAKKYLDAYVNNIVSLGDKAIPFSAKNLDNKSVEKSFVDVINNNNWLGSMTKSQPESKYDPNDILYQDKDIIILNTNSKAKCVKYGSDTTWCITKADQNYYNMYRLKYGATIYFVIQPNVPEPEDKLAILIYGPDEYAIADRTNDFGNKRSGSHSHTMTWNELLEIVPNLNGKQELMPQIKLTEDELDYAELVQEPINDTDIISYINQEIDGLIVNGSQVTVHDFLVDYIQYNKLKEIQLFYIPDNIIKYIVLAGYSFDPYSYKMLPPNIIKNAKIDEEDMDIANYLDIYVTCRVLGRNGYPEKKQRYIQSYIDKLKNLRGGEALMIIQYSSLDIIDYIIDLLKDNLSNIESDRLYASITSKNAIEASNERNGGQYLIKILPYIKDKLYQLNVDNINNLLKLSNDKQWIDTITEIINNPSNTKTNKQETDELFDFGDKFFKEKTAVKEAIFYQLDYIPYFKL